MRFTSLVALAAVGSATVQAAPQPLTVVAINVADGAQEFLEHLPNTLSSFFSSASSAAGSALEQAEHTGKMTWDSARAYDVCPSLTVSCVRKKDGKTVGALPEKKEFCWNRDDGGDDGFNGFKIMGSYLSGEGAPRQPSSKTIGCSQCEPVKNDAECNARFPDKCLPSLCEAKGPLGGH